MSVQLSCDKLREELMAIDQRMRNNILGTQKVGLP